MNYIQSQTSSNDIEKSEKNSTLTLNTNYENEPVNKIAEGKNQELGQLSGMSFMKLPTEICNILLEAFKTSFQIPEQTSIDLQKYNFLQVPELDNLEVEIIKLLVVDNLSNPQIAERIYQSEKKHQQIKNKFITIYEKLASKYPEFAGNKNDKRKKLKEIYNNRDLTAFL